MKPFHKYTPIYNEILEFQGHAINVPKFCWQKQKCVIATEISKFV